MRPSRLLAILLLLITSCTLLNHSASDLPKPPMVFIRGGSFIMGDIYNDPPNPDASPTHEVTLSSFKIGKYEVTYREYDAFARRTGCTLPKADSLGRGNRAVANVSWEDAKAFCAFHGWRLPTEQEWEYAARSGGQKIKYAGTSIADSLNLYARIDGNSVSHTYNVGSRKPNQVGLYDMSGNVFEWIGDYYQFYPSKGEAPKWEDMNERTLRILRGGSFKEGHRIASTYWRAGMLKNAKSYDLGFRCVDPLKKEKPRR